MNDTIDAQLCEIVGRVGEDKRGIAESLATEIAFMRDTLERLRDHVDEYGVTELYQNGRQQCWRESQALKSYNTTLKSYSATCKQLLALLPEDEPEDHGSIAEFMREF